MINSDKDYMMLGKFIGKLYFRLIRFSLDLLLQQCSTLQIQYKMTTAIDLIKDLFTGCCSGWGQVVCMLPFENIKIKVVSKPLQYNQGYIHAFKKTIHEEGPLSLYKGMLFPLLGVGAQVAVQFGFVETLKKMLKKSYADVQGNLHWKFSFLAGLISGIPSAFLATPLDHARFRVTLVKQKGMGSVKMAIHILKNYGLRKLFLGFTPTLARESVGLGCYFGTYDSMMRSFRKNGQVSLLGSLFSGGCAGIAFWIFIYPADYIKTLIQADSLDNPKYKGTLDCARQEYKTGGTSVFYRAFGIMMARAFVVNGFGFLCFQLAKKAVY